MFTPLAVLSGGRLIHTLEQHDAMCCKGGQHGATIVGHSKGQSILVIGPGVFIINKGPQRFTPSTSSQVAKPFSIHIF